MLGFKFQNSSEIDDAIVGSRTSKIVQMSAQFGGMALIGIAVEKLQGNPAIVSWLASMTLTGISVRLGFERGSAMRRQRSRVFTDAMGVADPGFTATERELGGSAMILGLSEPFVATNLAMWTGLQEGVVEYVDLPVAAGAGVAAIKLSENAGKGLDTKPLMHRIAHLY